MSRNNLPIGFFDSGVGGISVLAEAARLMPRESMIYFGDSLHNPYGTKEVKEVMNLSFQAAEFLINKGIKALVVACNTATSAAINELRENLDIPVIGMEPALKPGVQRCGQGRVVVMATPVTLREKKFQCLMNNYRADHQINPLPCPGLAELIEGGTYKGQAVQNYLANIFAPLAMEKVSVIVIGCTHYVFIKNDIAALFPQVELVDGNMGTVKNLQRILTQNNLLTEQNEENRTIQYYSTADPARFLPLYKELFHYCLKD
ncbi:MAG: glutamate racemase [Dehalobacterium sp.]|jgi:glutamate racemase